MPIFQQSDIIRFFNRGEQSVSNDCNFLLDRYELNVISGTQSYLIPDFVRSISRVTYLGKKLTPLPQRDFKDAFQSGTQQGRPFWYIFNNSGANTIKLFPCPNQTIGTGIDPWVADIPNCVIVEFFRISDNADFILPPWSRNYLLKKYVGKELFSCEGAGQNLKMAKYMASQWEQWRSEFEGIIDELHSAPRKLFVSDVVSGNWFPGSPLLPIDKFGISVETGY
jgi:hypothetical protein